MAALDFPASPSNGATYTGPGGVVWTWDGSKWVTQGIATAYLPLAGGQMTGPLGAISGGPPTASINFGGTANTGIYGNANLVGIMSGGQARFTVDGTGTYSQGPLTVAGDATVGGTVTLQTAPTLAAHATTKAYVDGKFPVPLATGVSGVLPVANGGTGASTGPAGPYLPLVAGSGNPLTGALYVQPASGSVELYLSRAAGSQAVIYGRTGSNARWSMSFGEASAESGSNTGSNFSLGRHADNGVFIDNPFYIPRSTGLIQTPIGLHCGDNNILNPASSKFTAVSNSGYASQFASWAVGGVAALCAISQTNGSLVFFQYWNGSALNGVGNITTNGSATAYNTSSDGRLKSDISPLTDSGAVIDQLQPVLFRWTAQPDEPPTHGFIAQDMYPIYPQPVSPGNELEPDEEGFRPWGMDHSHLVPLLTAEIKSLRARVAALEGATP